MIITYIRFIQIFSKETDVIAKELSELDIIIYAFQGTDLLITVLISSKKIRFIITNNILYCLCRREKLIRAQVKLVFTLGIQT